MPDLRIDGLCKRFGAQEVLRDIRLTVAEGTFCILLGPSGCGKTTLLRIIAGLEDQDRGSIHIGEDDVSELEPQQRDVAMVFQSYALYPHLTVRRNLAFPLKARKLPRSQIAERIERAARLLGITELLERKPRELSGGQRQRVAIGRALVRNPRLFLFDEPLSNLDAKLRANMRLELARLHRELATTMVYVTHDQVEAMTLGEYIVLLHQGVVQQQGPPLELYRRPANRFVAGFIGSPTMNFIDGEVERSTAGGVLFRAHGIEIEWEAEYSAITRKTEATLGIRPEHLTPQGHSSGSAAPIRGTVEWVENLGAETLLYVRTPAGILTGKADDAWQGRRGDPVALSYAAESLHVFCNDQRLEP